MGAYLADNPPTRSQYRRPRRERPSGVIVVHTAENTPDLVAFDGGAEAVARFIRGRSDPGSYHDLADSDSCINLVPYDAEAYHDGTGSNPHSYGLSVATRADVWPLAPQRWRDGAIRQAAAAARRYASWVKARYGITIPARRITRAQSDRRVPGFISHAERDPARRSDPGAAFPWNQFLDLYANQEDDDMDIADLRRELTTSGTPTRTAVRQLAAMGARDVLTTGGDPARVAVMELVQRGVATGLGYFGRRDGEGSGEVCFLLAGVVKVPVNEATKAWTDTLRTLAGDSPADVVDVPVEVWDGMPVLGSDVEAGARHDEVLALLRETHPGPDAPDVPAPS